MQVLTRLESDSEHRPITAGGFVKTGPVIFMDTAKAAGLTAWHPRQGLQPKSSFLRRKPRSLSLDYDNDGWLDIYLVNGSTYTLQGKEPHPQAALFHNNHDGTFTDVTKTAGVANERWGYGCAVGDFDNDGGRISMSRTTATIACIATTMMERSQTSRKKHTSRWVPGQQVRPLETTTATVG